MRQGRREELLGGMPSLMNPIRKIAQRACGATRSSTPGCSVHCKYTRRRRAQTPEFLRVQSADTRYIQTDSHDLRQAFQIT